MSGWFTRSTAGFATAVAGGVMLAVAILWIAERPAEGQARGYRAPRTADGKPDLNGIWQAVNTAGWNLEDHSARSGPVVAMGALGSIPGGMSVVEGGEIPYLPAARARR